LQKFCLDSFLVFLGDQKKRNVFYTVSKNLFLFILEGTDSMNP